MKRPIRTGKLIPMAVFMQTFTAHSVEAQVVWSDEFDSGSTPDTQVWSYDLGAWGWGYQELQEYTDQIPTSSTTVCSGGGNADGCIADRKYAPSTRFERVTYRFIPLWLSPPDFHCL